MKFRDYMDMELSAFVQDFRALSANPIQTSGPGRLVTDVPPALNVVRDWKNVFEILNMTPQEKALWTTFSTDVIVQIYNHDKGAAEDRQYHFYRL